MVVKWYLDAEEERTAAFDYSLLHFGRNAARCFDKELRQNDILLLQNPNMGTIEQRLNYLPVTIRYLVVETYKEYYYVKGDEIRILRLWHCAQNPTQLYAYFNAYPQILCEPQVPYHRTPKAPQTPDTDSEP